MEPLLEIVAVSKSFQKNQPVIDALDLSVQQGEIIALVGESGCGKTTLLRMIAGFEYADKGELYLNGKDIRFLAPEKRGIGMFFQDYALFPHLNVFDNICFGLSKQEKTQRKEELLSLMTLAGLEGLESRFPHELSGGQQQRVALLRALAPQPDLILLDEPFSNIDVLVKDQVREELHRLFKQTGVTVVFVTHDIKDALYLADRLVLMKSGKIIQAGSAKEIYHSPSQPYVAGFMGKINSIKACSCENGFESSFGFIEAPHELATGVNVLLQFRPEELELQIASQAKATVVQNYFLGNYSELRIQSDNEAITAQVTELAKWELGTKVALKLQRCHYWAG